jgi:hypothetical protein
MKKIPTRVHGLLDYSVAALLMALPWLLDLDEESAESRILMSMGAGAVAYSLLTDYELGAKPAISMKTHLAVDAANGALLAASPWLLRFADRVWLPHLLMGMMEVGVAAASSMNTPKPRRKPR